MAVTERWNRRRLNRDSVERVFQVTGTTDESVAEAAVLAAVPSTYLGMNLVDWDTKEESLGLFETTVTYKPFNPAQQEPAELGSTTGDVSYNTGSATARRLHSIQTIGSYTDGGFFGVGSTAPNFKGLIGVTRDGVEGVDVNVPAPTFRETHVFTASSVTASYRRTVSLLAYKANVATFKGYAPGEVLFAGAEFHTRDAESIVGTYDFLISENVTGLSIGDITGIDKDGWDYLWVLYNEEEDATAEYLVRIPTAVYVERVYERADLSALQIGT